MAKSKKGGLKLRQKGMSRPHSKKSSEKSAPWADPLANLARGGNRH